MLKLGLTGNVKDTYISDEESDNSPRVMSNKQKFMALSDDNHNLDEFPALNRDPSTFANKVAQEEEKTELKNQ